MGKHFVNVLAATFLTEAFSFCQQKKGQMSTKFGRFPPGLRAREKGHIGTTSGRLNILLKYRKNIR